ncbi:MAG: response regulator transcription factor [Flavobacteriales bacterium]|nr:response regulator transcription factor [Flavobacteriales bacterium]MCL4281865.1 response regulator transcription factor [Flavobacteriales bacterium]
MDEPNQSPERRMEQPASPIKLLICDDHRIIIDGLTSLLQDVDWIDVVGSASDGAGAIALVEPMKADLVLLDLNMPGMGGAEALRIIKQRWPRVKVVILTMEDGYSVVRNLLENGADGYVLKTCEQHELLQAIRAAIEGDRRHIAALAEAMQRAPVVRATAAGPLESLSPREAEVLKALAEGLSNKEIGEQLFISPRTVDTHRTNLMKKLGVHNLAGLVRLAISAGLIR